MANRNFRDMQTKSRKKSWYLGMIRRLIIKKAKLLYILKKSLSWSLQKKPKAQCFIGSECKTIASVLARCRRQKLAALAFSSDTLLVFKYM